MANDHDDFGGLHRDLRATGSAMDRRGLLKMATRIGVGAAALQLLGRGAEAAQGQAPHGSATSASGVCARVPQETAGPFPADGSNGPSVLSSTGVVRRDIRSSFAGLSGAADGVPLSIELTIVSAATCAPLAGQAVYIWLCDREGRYSLYSPGARDQNYLRGVQAADANGKVAFTSIFPACYPGRWPHIHFEVFPSLATATNIANRTATSQIALPKATCDAVYGTRGYASSIRNMSGLSLDRDMVFRDSAALELATVSGSVAGGFTASLTVAV